MRPSVWVLSLLLIGLAACGANETAAPVPTLPPLLVVAVTPAALPSATLLPAYTPTYLPTLIPPTFTPLPTPTPAPTLTPFPTPDSDAHHRQLRLPILMYHYVGPWPADADELRRNLTVRPEDFAAQMQYLHDHGYMTVSLYDLIYALALGWPLPEKPVVLTFDDGYRDVAQHVAPAVQPYGYTGTVFVITELMDREFEPYLTWPQAEALYRQGWKIEPHTKTHEQLAGRDRDFQLYQMLGAVQTVQAHIGVQPRFFNYPAGKYDDLTLQLAREMNLWGGVSVNFGRVHTLDSIYTLARVRVNGQGTLSEFVAGLEGDLAP